MTQTARMTLFPSGRRQLEGYRTRPDGDGLFPGIVIIHVHAIRYQMYNNGPRPVGPGPLHID